MCLHPDPQLASVGFVECFGVFFNIKFLEFRVIGFRDFRVESVMAQRVCFMTFLYPNP